jgi:hypothetical protein
MRSQPQHWRRKTESGREHPEQGGFGKYGLVQPGLDALRQIARQVDFVKERLFVDHGFLQRIAPEDEANTLILDGVQQLKIPCQRSAHFNAFGPARARVKVQCRFTPCRWDDCGARQGTQAASTRRGWLGSRGKA